MTALDSAMADGLLDTVRRAATELYGATQDYPCDDVKRMMQEVLRLRAQIATGQGALQAVKQHDISSWIGRDADANKRRSWRGVMRKVRAALSGATK